MSVKNNYKCFIRHLYDTNLLLTLLRGERFLSAGDGVVVFEGGDFATIACGLDLGLLSFWERFGGEVQGDTKLTQFSWLSDALDFLVLRGVLELLDLRLFLRDSSCKVILPLLCSP